MLEVWKRVRLVFFHNQCKPEPQFSDLNSAGVNIDSVDGVRDTMELEIVDSQSSPKKPSCSFFLMILSRMPIERQE